MDGVDEVDRGNSLSGRSCPPSPPRPQSPPVPEHLIVFTRFPEPGRAKTRLIPVLGPLGAANLQRRLIEETVAKARELARVRDLALAIHYSGGEEGGFRQWLAPEGGVSFQPQAPGDLGQRMHAAASLALGQGAGRLVLVGTDCPGLTPALLAQALDLLADYDLVLGPALDGGYYLIGLNRPAPFLFTEMPWGTCKVLAKTLERAAAHNLTVGQLETLSDVDRPEDLDYLHYHPGLE